MFKKNILRDIILDFAKTFFCQLTQIIGNMEGNWGLIIDNVGRNW
jgi:hypothetical protein